MLGDVLPGKGDRFSFECSQIAKDLIERKGDRFNFHNKIIHRTNIVRRKGDRFNFITEGLGEWAVNAADAGMVSAGQGQVKLHSTDGGGSVQLSQSIKTPLAGGRVGLRAWLKTEHLKPTGKWNTGRVILVQYQQGKPQYNAPHGLASLEGSNDWAEYHETFAILPGASSCGWSSS